MRTVAMTVNAKPGDRPPPMKADVPKIATQAARGVNHTTKILNAVKYM